MASEDSLRPGRPLLGPLVLALAGLALARLLGTTAGAWAGRLAPFVVAFGLALTLPVCAAVAVARPRHAARAGLAGAAAGPLVTLLVATGPTVPVRSATLLACLLATVLGGGLCAVGRPRRVTLGPVGSLSRAGRVGLVGGLVLVLVVGGLPVAASDRFPAQADAYGGFVVHQDTLEAGYYDYAPDCGTVGAECENITVDSSTRSSVRVARQRLDTREGNDVVLTNFLIYKNFYYEPREEFLSFELQATRAVATSGDGGRAIDVYISEFRSEQLEARLNFPLTDLDPQVDTIEYWTCTPYNDSGWGTINDDRLGLSTDPRLTDGEDVSLLAHQLGSSKTVLTDFRLTVERGRRQGLVTNESEPARCA